MNNYLFKIEGILSSIASFNGYIFKCQIETSREEAIARLVSNDKISNSDKGLLIHFFKTQKATEKLFHLAVKGFAFENDILLNTNLSILKKKKRIGMLIILLNNITSAINLYAELGNKDDDAQFDSIKAKLGKCNDNPIVNFVEGAANEFSDKFGSGVESGQILCEDDAVVLFGETARPELYLNLPQEVKFDLTDREIKFYHLYFFRLQLYYLIEEFAKQFKSELKFSLSNVINCRLPEIVNPKLSFDQSPVAIEIHHILRGHVDKSSWKDLDAFLTGKELSNKIKFLRGKQELESIFLLLYRNSLVSRKPKLIGIYISESFVFPGNEIIKSERVREFLTRTKANDSFAVLLEIVTLVKKRKLHW